MLGKGLLLTGAVLLAPLVASPYTMVLKNGQRIEAEGRFHIEDGQVQFVGVNGRNYQFRLAEVNLIATQFTNRQRETGKVWTNEDLESLAKTSPLSTVGPGPTEPAPATPSTPASAPTQPAITSPAVEQTEGGGVAIEPDEGGPTEAAPTQPAPPPPAQQQPPPTETRPQPPQEETAAYWQQRLKPLREELAAIDRQIQEFRRGQGRAASNAVDLTQNAPGVQVEDAIRLLEQRRAEIQRRIEEIQLDAKRKGIPPGALR